MLLVVLFMSSACTQEAKEVFIYEKDFRIYRHGNRGNSRRRRRNSGKGDGVAVIKAASDGWGGVQSEKVTLICQNPMLLVQVRRILTDSVGRQVCSSNLQVEDHAWGFYLIEDNNFKWNNYAEKCGFT